MGIMLIVAGLFIIISVIVYIYKELKGTTWKEKMFVFVDHITDFVWLQLNWTTIFMIVGLLSFLIGVAMVLDVIA